MSVEPSLLDQNKWMRGEKRGNFWFLLLKRGQNKNRTRNVKRKETGSWFLGFVSATQTHRWVYPVATVPLLLLPCPLPASFASFLLLLWCLLACGPRGRRFLLSGWNHVAGGGWGGAGRWARSGGGGGAAGCLTGVPEEEWESRWEDESLSRH